MRGFLTKQENTNANSLNKTPEEGTIKMTASIPAKPATIASQKAPGLISQELWNLFLLQQSAKKKPQAKR
jgi:hypothetical protein